MEHINLTLDENKSFVSTNQVNNLHIDLEREEKLLPVNDLQGKIDAYEQYLKEKDACNKYRFVFTIHPYCTNVLFNHITEAVYMEGSDKAKLVQDEYEASQNTSLGYTNFKCGTQPIEGGAIIDKTHGAVLGSPITRDTGYSSDSFNSSGNQKESTFLNYNCGLDIFNNHLLRRKEFVCINKWKESSSENKYFNTIFDYVRDPWGNTIQGFTWTHPLTPNETTNLHVYNTDNIYSFRDSITHNLREQNGWLGFYNTSILNTISEVINDKSGGNINKVLNNVESCAFVDMYPTRRHYSFVPYFNKYRKRVENNWEYILTYPYKNIYDTPLTFDDTRQIHGVLCDLVLDDYTLEQLLGMDDDNKIDVPLIVSFKTHMKHTLLPSDRIILHVYNNTTLSGGTDVYTLDNVVVQSIGDNGYDGQYYFSVRLNDISTDLELAYLTDVNSQLGFRFEKISVGAPCRYYVRKFKKLPNFKNTNINISDGITDAELNDALNKSDFSSSLNKLGFSKTVYGDDVAQIVYDDDIDITGLKDNYGRQLSVLYLTLIKTNKGHVEWYDDGDYASPVVEYSHCFGEITSGFDLPVNVTDQKECNVRRQHNVTGENAKELNQIPISSDFMEYDITKNGLCDSVTGEYDYEFYGDIVEFDTTTLEEHVIERIQHRFNTAQREFSTGNKIRMDKNNSNPFSFLVIDDIVSDDYSPNGFITRTKDAVSSPSICNYWANIAPEGYFYCPHYPIKIKEFDATVNTGYHTQINFTCKSGSTTITTDTNYYIETNQELFMFHKDINDKHKYVVRVSNVSGDDFTTIDLITNGLVDNDLNNYLIFKPNVLKPEGAYDFSELEPDFVEKSGRYLWRDVTPTSKIPRDSELYDVMFTNGAIYIHKNINFYLKRQDPYGEYGLHPTYVKNNDSCMMPWELEFDGMEKDISSGDYFEPGENNIC